MPFPITCPGCKARMTGPDEVAGKRIKCKSCGEAFVARGSSPEEPNEPIAETEDAEPRPRRSRKQVDEAAQRRRREEREEVVPEPAKQGRAPEWKPIGGAGVLVALGITFVGLLLSAGLTLAAAHFLSEKEPKRETVPFEEAQKRGQGPVMKGVGAGVPNGKVAPEKGGNP